MKNKNFFKNGGTIFMFAFLGTFISIITVSLLTFALGQVGWANEFSMKESWAFGSLISATDPVSVLAIFKEIGADPHLYSLIFGESILNDAVSMVMYKTVLSFSSDGPLSR